MEPSNEPGSQRSPPWSMVGGAFKTLKSHLIRENKLKRKYVGLRDMG